MHHALMWNIGTTGRIVSCDDTHRMPGLHTEIAFSAIARCEYSAPLGFPVVPEV